MDFLTNAVAFVFVLSIVGFTRADERAEAAALNANEQAGLQGTWLPESAEFGGKAIAEPPRIDFRNDAGQAAHEDHHPHGDAHQRARSPHVRGDRGATPHASS